MDDRQLLELLQQLIEVAGTKENCLRKSEIDDCFLEFGLTAAQMEPIYDYLEQNQVYVLENLEGERLSFQDGQPERGSEKAKGAEDTQGEARHTEARQAKARHTEARQAKARHTEVRQAKARHTEVRQAKTRQAEAMGTEARQAEWGGIELEGTAAQYDTYLDEMNSIKPCTLEEIQELLPLAAAGEAWAADRLAEGNLGRVVQWARRHVGKGVPFSDLIQEGSMMLMEEICALGSGYVNPDGEDFLFILEKKCNTALKRLISEQEGQKSVSEKLASRANRIMELTEEIAEEYGTEAAPAQLAERLHITEDEVREIMKLSLDVISVAESRGDPGAFEGEESRVNNKE